MEATLFSTDRSPEATMPGTGQAHPLPGSPAGGPVQLRWYQLEAIEATWSHIAHRDDNPAIVMPTGCHAAGHPILMFDGSIRAVEHVAVGDRVMGPDSRPRIVLELRRGRDQMYRVTPKKGRAFVVNGEHVLSLICTNEGKSHACSTKGGEIDNVALDDWRSRSKSWRHLRKLRRVAVDFHPIERPDLDPWTLGALLGDGYLVGGIKFSKPDVEILDAVWTEMQRHGLAYNARERGGAWHVRFSHAGAHRSNPNPVFEILRAIGLDGCLSESKFIPDCYKRGSRDDRLAVLAGLLDTDGCMSHGGFDFISKSRQLSEDVVFVSRSLGLNAQCVECVKSCQTGATGTYWRVSISGDCSIIPMRCTRKRAAPRTQKKNPLVCGFEVESIGEGDYFGFLLDGDHLYLDGEFMVHHNSGKTPVIATLCQQAVQHWGGRVLVATHVRELIEQSAKTLQSMAPSVSVGIYSAGLKRRDKRQPVIVAGIQSIYERGLEFDPFDLVIVDEAHLIPDSGEGMYRRFLNDLRVARPTMRVIGLTATPYRMHTPVCSPENFLNHICYEVGVRELIVQGYLCSLRSKAGHAKADLSQVHVRGGEFVASELEGAMNLDALVESAVDELVRETKQRRSVLIFASGVDHAKHIAEAIVKRGHEAVVVTGETPIPDRDRAVDRFRRGGLKYLVNYGVFTTGFDAPNVDAIVLLRATMSPGLYYQMAGRGFRIAPGKTDCIILDYGDNVLRHGPVDQLSTKIKEIQRRKGLGGDAPAKQCANCDALVAAGYTICPECGTAFPERQRTPHNAEASTAGVLSYQVETCAKVVKDIEYSVHYKRDAEGKPPTLRVRYYFDYYMESASEWVCIEHAPGGFARRKAEEWWSRHSERPFPSSVAEAVQLCEDGEVRRPTQVELKRKAGEKWWEVARTIFPDEPGDAPVAPLATNDDLVGEIPF